MDTEYRIEKIGNGFTAYTGTTKTFYKDKKAMEIAVCEWLDAMQKILDREAKKE